MSMIPITVSDAREDLPKKNATDVRSDTRKARMRMSIEDVIAIIDDLYREGVIDYMQAWELRMRVRAKGADDESTL